LSLLSDYLVTALTGGFWLATGFAAGLTGCFGVTPPAFDFTGVGFVVFWDLGVAATGFFAGVAPAAGFCIVVGLFVLEAAVALGSFFTGVCVFGGVGFVASVLPAGFLVAVLILAGVDFWVVVFFAGVVFFGGGAGLGAVAGMSGAKDFGRTPGLVFEGGSFFGADEGVELMVEAARDGCGRGLGADNFGGAADVVLAGALGFLCRAEGAMEGARVDAKYVDGGVRTPRRLDEVPLETV